MEENVFEVVSKVYLHKFVLCPCTHVLFGSLLMGWYVHNTFVRVHAFCCVCMQCGGRGHSTPLFTVFMQHRIVV